ncbi:hypothetical protein [Rubinisphaera margarita]|uniref:hypothetical protein n=1 Tax=Rubinisphaera margarita TaxID=2909586 RepID=UPI001EE887DD|nr:hypothetical protein [Rubinisphaera margarita]MCG6157705.1 hypothetical protein [Rubinisphaera margarita]
MPKPASHSANRMHGERREAVEEIKPAASNIELAELISYGLVPFPDDLSHEQATDLLLKVRQFRRRRLVRLIAQAIAQDIMSGNRHCDNLQGG